MEFHTYFSLLFFSFNFFSTTFIILLGISYVFFCYKYPVVACVKKKKKKKRKNVSLVIQSPPEASSIEKAKKANRNEPKKSNIQVLTEALVISGLIIIND